MAITLDGTTGITTPDSISHSGDTNTAIRFPAADTVTVETSGAERVRVDNGGNLLVGTTSTGFSAEGHVFRAGDYASHTVDGDVVMLLNRTTSDGGILQFRKDGTTVGSIGTNGGSPYFTTTNGGFRIAANGALQPATSTGAVSDALEDLGSTSGRWSNLYLSGGVYLGGTGSANLLDDYEEGTWTPVIRGQSTAGSYPLSIATGSYTKVGRFVNVSLRIVISSVSSAGSSYMQITGLPFIKASNGILSDSAVRLRSTTGVTSYDWPTLEMVTGSSTNIAYIFCNQVNSSGFDLPVSGVQASTEISGHLFYEV